MDTVTLTSCLLHVGEDAALNLILGDCAVAKKNLVDYMIAINSNSPRNHIMSSAIIYFSRSLITKNFVWPSISRMVITRGNSYIYGGICMWMMFWGFFPRNAVILILIAWHCMLKATIDQLLIVYNHLVYFLWVSGLLILISVLTNFICYIYIYVY